MARARRVCIRQRLGLRLRARRAGAHRPADEPGETALRRGRQSLRDGARRRLHLDRVRPYRHRSWAPGSDQRRLVAAAARPCCGGFPVGHWRLALDDDCRRLCLRFDPSKNRVVAAFPIRARRPRSRLRPTGTSGSPRRNGTRSLASIPKRTRSSTSQEPDAVPSPSSLQQAICGSRASPASTCGASTADRPQRVDLVRVTSQFRTRAWHRYCPEERRLGQLVLGPAAAFGRGQAPALRGDRAALDAVRRRDVDAGLRRFVDLRGAHPLP